jgi:hypothetical protein
MAYYSETTLRCKLALIRERGLSVPDGFWDIPVVTLLGIVNGVGPGAWSRMARKVSTTLQPHAELAAIIHDVEYCHPDKSRTNFDRANQRFRDNIRRDIQATTWRWNPMRIPLYLLAEIEFQAVQRGGWDAWCIGATLPQLAETKGAA